MYVDTGTSNNLRRSIFNDIVVPRPIGWISSRSAKGLVNLAPFSHFNIVSTAPPVILFSCNTPDDRAVKDTLANVRETGEFVYNVATFALGEAVNLTSSQVGPELDEFELAGLDRLEGVAVSVPRVASSPASLECKLLRVVTIEPQLPSEAASYVVFGRVVGLHIKDEHLSSEGRFAWGDEQPICRLGGYNYAAIRDVFEMRPAFRSASDKKGQAR